MDKVAFAMRQKNTEHPDQELKFTILLKNRKEYFP